LILQTAARDTRSVDEPPSPSYEKPAQRERSSSLEPVQTSQEFVAQVAEIAHSAGREAARAPALAIMFGGIVLMAATFIVEVFSDRRLTSSEFITGLVTGAFLCAIGAVLEVNRVREVGSVTKAGIERLPAPEASLNALRRLKEPEGSNS
jgi:hypothetical protein